jgi:hypothetical protein
VFYVALMSASTGVVAVYYRRPEPADLPPISDRLLRAAERTETTEKTESDASELHSISAHDTEGALLVLALPCCVRLFDFDFLTVVAGCDCFAGRCDGARPRHGGGLRHPVNEKVSLPFVFFLTLCERGAPPCRGG